MPQKMVEIPEDVLPVFDELYVISDLHLGGERGFQIFGSTADLVRLIGHLRTQPPGIRLGLVINGDFTDFLAQPVPRRFDPDSVVAKIGRIFAPDGFEPILSALQSFTATANRYLIVTLGNHDIELALPWVRLFLLDRLSGGDDAARGRITLAFDGAGFLCRVGPARVLAVHGNDDDLWNVVDHEALRRQGQWIQHGRPVEADWTPNAGTQLVIEVMNEVKRRYPFVDLLKPETEAVLPSLLALDPTLIGRISALGPILARMKRDTLRRETGLLSADTTTVDAHPPLTLPLPGLAGDTRALPRTLLDDAEKRLEAKTTPLSLVDGDKDGQYLGKISAIGAGLSGQPRAEVLRQALSGLKEDRSFALDGPDAIFDALDGKIGRVIDIVIAGHTHLERSRPRTQGGGWYFNSGTWARLIQFTPALLDDPARFAKVFESFQRGDMAALDELEDLVIRRQSVVAVWVEGNRAVGDLRRVMADDPAVLVGVPGSRSMAF